MGDRIDDLTVRVEAVEAKMDQVPATLDQRFDAVDAALVEQRQYTEFAFDRLEQRFAEVKAEVRIVTSGLGRLERKLDQVIDRLAPPPTPEQPT